MTLSRKYAALPDLDSAPDIYETPSLTDDNSTVPGGTARSNSASSHYTDFDSAPGSPPGSPQISRSRLHPDAARSRFEPALIDAKDVDFSDRISGKKKSYRASSRRVRVLQDGTREMGDLSDEEDGAENLERKLARLRREIEEVREETEQRKRERTAVGVVEEDDAEDEAAGLSRMLDALSMPNEGPASSVTRLSKSLSKQLAQPAAPAPTFHPTSSQPANTPATYTVSYAPSYDSSHTLSRITTFDARLAALESSLGLASLSNTPQPVLPTLTTLSQKLAVISTATPSSVDALSRRVRTLTAEAEKLAAAKQAARQPLSPGTERAVAVKDGASEAEEGEQALKINALYGTLATIESLAPLLPGVLERLRSLKKVHADAAAAAEELDEAMRRQERMGAEIEKWREGLERVEAAVRDGERVGGENVKTVEGWVRELEERVKKLGA